MRFHEDRAARRLIHATALHADNTVFDDIDDADAILSAELVECKKNLLYRHLLSVQRNRHTFFPINAYIGLLIRSLFRCDRKKQHMIIVRCSRRILKLQTFMGKMHDITVTAIAVFRIELKRDAL